MKTRIVKVMTPFSGVYYEPQFRTWYGAWKPIYFYYKSDFVDMPGHFTCCAVDIEMAEKEVRRFKQSGNKVVREILSNGS